MFTFPDPNQVIYLHGEYSLPIVALSIVIACCASYTALSMNERIQKNSFFHRNIWLTLASIAMGLGIWSMHFIGMAAFMLPVSMKYDVFTTIISAIPAIIASFLAFYIASRQKRLLRSTLIAGMIMGIGISTMHYLGMAAMKMEANYVYRPWLFAASIGIAIIVSLIAIYIFSSKQRLMGNFLIKGITAMIMGLAVASMHYTGMEAIVFYLPESSSQLINHVHNMDTTLIIVGVTVGIALLLGFSAFSSIVDRYVDYRLNYFDALTKLPNRRQFEKLLKSPSSTGYIAIIHIHGLAEWNSGYGYELGDEIIRTIGQLALKLKPTSVSLYRIEGNRFALYTNHSHEYKKLTITLEQVSSILAKPIVVKDQSLTVKTASSYAVTRKSADVPRLFENAMAVLQHPTINYEHEVIEYDPAIHTYSFEQKLILDIDQAMQHNDLFVVYQPKVCLKTKEVSGLEALLRWNHPSQGPISPGVFIPILEEHGKMFDVTDWIIDRVCQQIKKWKYEGHINWKVAINIPGPYVTSSRLMKALQDSIEKYDIEANQMELEMTETSVVSNIESAIHAVNNLRALGFPVALDDFGTGVSSLSYLKRLPITTLKIDKTFVDDVPSSEKDSAIMKAIISLCYSLNLEIVIEGVETKDQIEFLRSTPEALIVQGYYFARPMSEKEIDKWYENFKGKEEVLVD
ncbi:putative bifunctional diguanylate cyclase/phosphodiesterase [Radiobacillus sp. PE A8.2]|uniref:putative bifunctional diguanylate cyclase/phosphodiesterase n=1 Tax=Radiobacillus sp. PE A8.2 TaxID=3380349 RepID=UPI00388F62B1